ncbi:MAG: 3'(2'),5'-bisphosphate nucleotidase CysQ [Pseudaminobacter sp.]
MPGAEISGAQGAQEDLPLLLEAAREAGKIAMRYFGKSPEVWMKAGQSPVSEADYAADTFLRETLGAARPDYGWLSEETVDTAERMTARRTFVVDPIDGTRGFLEGNSAWCVSVAVVEAGRTIVGVLDCPVRQEIYSALPGKGAWKNGTRISVREPGTNLEIGGPQRFVDLLPPEWRRRVRRMPHVPSLAYRLAMIAEGSIDATFVKPNAHDWDIAAVDLILSEAGGRLLDAQGKHPTYASALPRHGVLVGGSGELLGTMAGAIATAGI